MSKEANELVENGIRDFNSLCEKLQLGKKDKRLLILWDSWQSNRHYNNGVADGRNQIISEIKGVLNIEQR